LPAAFFEEFEVVQLTNLLCAGRMKNAIRAQLLGAFSRRPSHDARLFHALVTVGGVSLTALLRAS
jgi:hypothetical protein